MRATPLITAAVGALMALAAIAGCGHPAASGPVTARVGSLASVQRAPSADTTALYPLVAGQAWQYQLQQQQGQNPVHPGAMTVAVSSVQDQGNGLTLAVLDRQYGSFRPPSTRVLRDARRVVLSRLSDPVDGPSLTILQLPLVPGQGWPGRAFGGGNSETVVPAGAETVSVPAGTYRAQRVDHQIQYANGAHDTLSYWYAPGVGVVKMIERSTLFPDGAPPIHLTATGLLVSYGPAVTPPAPSSAPVAASRATTDGREARTFEGWMPLAPAIRARR